MINNTSNKKQNNLLGVRGKLLLGFFSIIIIFLISISITLGTISSIKSFSFQVKNVALPTYDQLIDLSSSLNTSQLSIQTWLITNDDSSLKTYQESWKIISSAVTTINTLSLKWNNANLVNHWEKTKNQITQLRMDQDSIIHTNDKAAALSILKNKVNPDFIELTNTLNFSMKNEANTSSGALLDEQSVILHQGTTGIIEDLSTLQLIEYVIIALGIIVSIFISIITSKSIINHLNIFRKHSSKVAAGDLTEHIDIHTDDEMGQLGDDLNKMTSSLALITREIMQACQNMVVTIEEVRHAMDSQTTGASEQAASINQITASISEIEKSSTQTMEKAKMLGDTAEKTREKGQLGVDSVEESVKGMKIVRDKVQIIAQTILELSEQTQQVGEITSVVNNLAQQSKMLALNASIEAAKAGEAGKGFAVVASEVKNLAEQSEQSTTQVQKILENIRHAAEKAVMVTEEGTKGVDHGTNLVEQTGDIIRSLNDVINEATLASQQIEAAVRQESAGIEQITAGMNEINQVTGAFLDGVKQTTEAVTNLSSVAKKLKSQVDTYKVE